MFLGVTIRVSPVLAKERFASPPMIVLLEQTGEILRVRSGTRKGQASWKDGEKQRAKERAGKTQSTKLNLCFTSGPALVATTVSSLISSLMPPA
jgi:hypothetical protein